MVYLKKGQTDFLVGEKGMRAEFIEKIYAGWLAKIIGIRYGAPIEGWTYEKIKNIYGELDHYPVDYHEFAADDDSNGPLFFLKALEDGRHGYDVKAQDVAEALLNYAPFEHGFFWWGGYGSMCERGSERRWWRRSLIFDIDMWRIRRVGI